MTSREGGSNYRVSWVNTLSGYQNTITAASKEKGNTVSEWLYNIQSSCNTTIIIQKQSLYNNSTRKQSTNTNDTIFTTIGKIQWFYPKIYGSNAVGRRRVRTGSDVPELDWVWDSESPQYWQSSSKPRRGWLSPSGMSCPSVGVCVRRESGVYFRHDWWWWIAW